MSTNSSRPLLIARLTTAMFACSIATAQQPAAKPQTQPVELDEVIIAAPKLSKGLLESAFSATVADGKEIEARGAQTLKDASFTAPNTFFGEFAARKLSNPRFRGIGGYPSQGATVYYDNVPQFHANSSSLTLVDVDQVDFVRGPQAALFGRNTPGGLMSVTSRRPSMGAWSGTLETTHGNYNLQDYRGSITGALVPETLGFSLAGGYNGRDGYTENTVTGNDVDWRRAWFGKMQFLWTPSKELEVRFILAGESARDGDYGLNDLAQLRANPRRTQRNFEGFTNRDVLLPTLQITYHADAFDFTSTTGFVWWETTDFTDLDYTAAPILTRRNHEQQSTWTQEFRFANPTGKPIVLGEQATLAWQAGMFLFHQQYDQDIEQVSAFPPTFLTRTLAGFQDNGIGVYLQSTLSLWKRLDLSAGLRWDYEDREAALTTARTPVNPADTVKSVSRSFSRVTPQAALSYKITPDTMAYFSFAGGYKAGGFNTATIAGRDSYDEEHSWNYELGLKGRALDQKLDYSLAVFYTAWKNLQLNSLNLGSPSFFDIINAGDASSKGIEFALNYRPTSSLNVYGSLGFQNARFHAGTLDGGANLGGNHLPFAPAYTAAFGLQYTHELGGGWNAYGRAEIQNIGAFNYNNTNTAAQDAYTLANFRLGVRNQSWFIEGFVNNAFDTNYVPMAIAYGALAPSGFVGESGVPLTFGVRTGIKF